DTLREAKARLVLQWVKDGGVKEPSKVTMLACLNHDTRELNLMAQAERIRAGEVHPTEKIYINKFYLHLNDCCQFTKPASSMDIQNGDVGTVTSVDPKKNRLTVKLEKDGREVLIDLKRYSPDNFRLSYAQTCQKLQGATGPHVHILLGGPMADLHTGLVSLSRSRVSTYAFISKQDAGPELRDIIRTLGRERMKT